MARRPTASEARIPTRKKASPDSAPKTRARPGGRGEARAKLAGEAARFRLLVDGITDYAIFLVEPDGRVATWNAGAERIKGYRAEEIVGEPVARFYLPDDVARSKPGRTLEVAAAQGRVEDQGWRVRKDGTRFWADVVITALRDDDGVLVGFAKVVRDLTERRRAEDALRESEERYRLLFENSPVPAWVFEVETLKFLAVNEAAVQKYGYDRDELLTMTIADIRPPEDVPALLEAVSQVRPRREVRSAWRHRKKDGTLIDVEITSYGLTFDGRPAELVLAHDITERRQVEDALRAAEEYARLIVDSAYDAFVSMDQSGVITGWNRQAEKVFGWPREEAVGRSLAETIIPSQHREAHRRGLERFLATGEGPVLNRVIEITALRRDGTEFPVELTISPLQVAGRHVFTAFVSDITDRKRAQETLTRYAAELEVSNAELDAFAYSVSHDLQAPLRSIDGFSQVLLEDYSDRIDDAGRDSLHRVRAASQRMAALIDDLLRLSRVTRAEMHREPVDLSALAGSIAADLKRREPSRRVEFAIAPGLTAEGDSRLLRVALENLLENAWKYTRKRERAHIEFAVTHGDGSPVYHVRDDGVGFDMAYAERLFGAFQRLHAESEFAGSGIGLATAQRIIHRHGGRIWAESAVDRGATFYFTLSSGGTDRP